MKAKDKTKANNWIKENYPDGTCAEMSDGEMYVKWDLLLELMVLYAGDCDYRKLNSH